MQTEILRNENDPYETGQKIRERRKALGLSQDQLADRMGSSRTEVSRHENGNNEMSVCTLYQYAEALETTPLQLSPNRFRETGTEQQILDILGCLSEDSRQMILSTALHLQQLESKT